MTPTDTHPTPGGPDENEAPSPSTGADPSLALCTRGLVKTYPGTGGLFPPRKTVVDRVDLTVEAGTIYGFLGKNGAGKTTTIKMILGLTYPTSGRIEIFGRPHDEIEVRRGLGFAPEKPVFYPHLTGREVLRYVGQLAGLSNADIETRSQKLLELVSLQGDGDRLVKEFSKGMQQRLGLVQSLIADPKLIIFDEPATGLDPFGRKLVKELILAMKAEGRTVFFSSHQLLDVQEVCDRVGIIHHGRLMVEDPVEELTRGGHNLEERFVQLITEHDRAVGRVSTID